MCLIIAIPANAEVSPKWMQNAWDTNPDGAGIAYAMEGEVRIDKGHMTYDAFITAYNAIPKTLPRVVHFRYATLGVINEENTHPFYLDKSGAAMFHNGPCVSESFEGDNQRSDSRHFAEDMMAHLDAHTIKHLKPVWEGFIEQGNKLVMLYGDGSMDIINESLGKWKKGVWLSNTYSIEPPLSSRAHDSSWTWGSSTAKVEIDTPILMYLYNGDKVEAVESFYPDWTVGDYYSYAHHASIEEMLEAWAKVGREVKYVFNSVDSYVTALMKDYGVEKYTPPLTTVNPKRTVINQPLKWGNKKWGR